MIYTINNCIRAFGYTDFNKLVEDKGSIDGLKEYVRANGYADIAVAEDTELLLVDVNGKTWHTGCYGAQLEPEPEPEPERDYLCFTSTGDSTVAMTQEGTPDSSANKVIQYKLNNGQWQTWDLSAVTLYDGDKMYLKSDDEIPVSEATYIYKQFEMTGSIAASGNIMSLLNFSDTLTYDAFYGLFKNCSALTTAPELPATTLADSCYASMFSGCTSLIQAPALPATTLAQYCYNNIFNGCTALTATPELPATEFATSCYSFMFYNCTSLTQAPELPVTELADSCYDGMFNGCTSLTTAPELPATTLASGCYFRMFGGCTSLTQAPALPATTLSDSCYNSMFQNCTSLTQAPELPATTLAQSCYGWMFYGCRKLNYVKAMFTEVPSEVNAVGNWLRNVSQTGTFVKNAAATWTNEQGGIPSGWTVQVEGGVTPEPEPERDYLCFTSTGDSTVEMIQNGTPNTSANKVIQYKLNDGQWQNWDLSAVTLADGYKMYVKSDDEIPMCESTSIHKQFHITGSIAASGNIMSLLNFSTTLTDYAFAYLFYACRTLTATPELPATTLAASCYYGMFEICTSLTTAPELPATTLTERCYYEMFKSCSSLTTAPALPATTLNSGCYSSMFQGCTSLTQAPELPATILYSTCYYYMFEGCTKLNYVKAMFINIAANSVGGWLNNVSATGTFVKNASATWTNEQAGIPTGWTVQTASPDK